MTSPHASASHGVRRRRALARQGPNHVSQAVVALAGALVFCVSVLVAASTLCWEFQNWCPAVGLAVVAPLKKGFTDVGDAGKGLATNFWEGVKTVAKEINEPPKVYPGENKLPKSRRATWVPARPIPPP